MFVCNHGVHLVAVQDASKRGVRFGLASDLTETKMRKTVLTILGALLMAAGRWFKSPQQPMACPRQPSLTCARHTGRTQRRTSGFSTRTTQVKAVRAPLAMTGSREIPTTRRRITRGGRPGENRAPGIAATTVGKAGRCSSTASAWNLASQAVARSARNIHKRTKGGAKPPFVAQRQMRLTGSDQ